jgi:protein PhnA
MSDESQPCPKCQSPYSYHDGSLWICSECAHEWTLGASESNEEVISGPKFLDANGVQLQSGDTVRTIKDLKVGSETIKSGTKVKGIRLLDDPVNGHDISCKVEGLGSIYLKCSVVKKD